MTSKFIKLEAYRVVSGQIMNFDLLLDRERIISCEGLYEDASLIKYNDGASIVKYTTRMSISQLLRMLL